MTVENSNRSTYTVVRSTRAKNMRITIRETGVLVTIPYGMSMVSAERYILEKKEWIDRSVLRIQRRVDGVLKIPKATKKDYLEKKTAAHRLVTQSLLEWNTLYKLTWNTVTIKNTSSRWGSCSKKRNLNFNYRIVYLPKNLADYLIVHELCHLQEMNHREGFWKLVEKAIPDYKKLRKELVRIS